MNVCQHTARSAAMESHAGKCGQEDERGQALSTPREPLDEGVLEHFLPLGTVLLEAAPYAPVRIPPVHNGRETCAEHARVQHKCRAQMRGEPVLRHARNGPWGVHERILQTGLDHVPAESALSADEQGHGGQVLG